MQILQIKLDLLRHKQKARLSRITKNLTVNLKNLQNKTWLELWKQDYDNDNGQERLTNQPDNIDGSEDLAKN